MPKRIELKKGEQFGRLRIIERAENKNNKTRWLCQCVCGNRKHAYTIDLLRKHITSCGCYKKFRCEILSARRFIDLEGKTFGRLKVVEMAFKRKKQIYWKCACKCGSIHFISGSSLRGG